MRIPEVSRIAPRLYTDLIEDAIQMRGWTKADLAKEATAAADHLGLKAVITAEQVYEYLERPREARAGFAKLIEWTLGVNLPPNCYWNAAKRSA